MDKELLIKLKPLVNDPYIWDLVQEYLSARIATNLKSLEHNRGFEEQDRGALRELRFMSSLRDRVNGEVK